MELTTRKIVFHPFGVTAKADQATLEAWRSGDIEAEDAALRLSDHNSIRPQLLAKELIEIAHKCGYWHKGTMPGYITKATNAYGRTHRYEDEEESN